MAIPSLQSIGLSEKEARLYEVLLPLGDIALSDLVKVSSLHPQIVSRLVESLVAKGLAVTSVRKHRKHVRAEDPRMLEQKEKEKLEEVQRLIPQLLALQKIPKEALVRVARGNEAVRSLRIRGIKELPKGGTYYIIGGSGDRFYEVMGAEYERVEKQRLKKAIWKKLITFESQRKELEKNEKSKKYDSFRYLSEHFPIPSSTNVFNDTVAIIIWAKDPIVITIESHEVAESYGHYFMSLWKIAKP